MAGKQLSAQDLECYVRLVWILVLQHSWPPLLPLQDAVGSTPKPSQSGCLQRQQGSPCRRAWSASSWFSEDIYLFIYPHTYHSCLYAPFSPLYSLILSPFYLDICFSNFFLSVWLAYLVFLILIFWSLCVITQSWFFLSINLYCLLFLLGFVYISSKLCMSFKQCIRLFVEVYFKLRNNFKLAEKL